MDFSKDMGWLFIALDVVFTCIIIFYIWKFREVLPASYKYGYTTLVVAMAALSCYRIYYFYF